MTWVMIVCALGCVALVWVRNIVMARGGFEEPQGRRDIETEYFDLLHQMEAWQKARRYDTMLACCSQTMPLLREFVAEVRRKYGSFEIGSIPAIEVGCRYWAALGDLASLEQVSAVVSSTRELAEFWGDRVDEAFQDARLADSIRRLLSEKPGVEQRRLGKELGAPGTDTSRIVHTLANLGIVQRTKSGRSYKLYLGQPGTGDSL